MKRGSCIQESSFISSYGLSVIVVLQDFLVLDLMNTIIAATTAMVVTSAKATIVKIVMRESVGCSSFSRVGQGVDTGPGVDSGPRVGTGPGVDSGQGWTLGLGWVLVQLCGADTP